MHISLVSSVGGGECEFGSVDVEAVLDMGVQHGATL